MLRPYLPLFLQSNSLFMRTILVIILFLSGCAHTQSYTPPEHLGNRMVMIGNSVLTCIDAPVSFYIANTKGKNAWIIDEKVCFTEGLFEFDDDTLKFVMAHEISHFKLGHLKSKKIVSYVTTGAMILVDCFVPGVGLLNYFINPAVVNNFSKPQELEADKLASKTCLCLGISIEAQVEILEKLKANFEEGGGFWAQHPSWDDRISNIKAP